MEEGPSLLREIGKVAWFFTKVITATCTVAALFAWLIAYHPPLGMIAFYALVIVALIVYLGWQNYKWKLRDLESRRKWEADAAKWKRAS